MMRVVKVVKALKVVKVVKVVSVQLYAALENVVHKAITAAQPNQMYSLED